MGLRTRVRANPVRKTLVAALGEFIGTFMFLFFAFVGAQATILNTRAVDTDKAPDIATLVPLRFLLIVLAFGVGLTVNVWIFYRVSGGMFNPAVTLGLVLVGAVSPRRALAVVPAQLLAGIAASGVTALLLPGPLLVANELGPQTSVIQGLLLETLFTAQLVLTVYFLAVEKHRATFLAPVGIGASVFLAHIVGIGLTGVSINPARTFGPALLTKFSSYHWIYWIGPFAGALLAFAVYSTLKWLDYQTANPGQDGDGMEGEQSKLSLAERDGSSSPHSSLGLGFQKEQPGVVTIAQV